MLREIVAIIRKDLRQARRDPRHMMPSLIVPFILLLVYSILWFNVGGGESFDCGLVVLDDSPQAETMASILETMSSTTNHTWFAIHRYNLTEAEFLFSTGSLVAYILIPSGFGENVSHGKQATITLFCNNINDDVVKNYIHRIEAAVLLFNQGAYSPDFNQSGAPIAIAETRTLSTTPSNLAYMGASSLILSVMVCALAGQALLTATEFESRAIYDTLNSPSSRLAISIGHTVASIPRTLLVLLLATPMVLVLVGPLPFGNPLALLVILVVTTIALVPIGEILGIVTKNREQALLGSVLITITGFLIGGGLAPVSLLPFEIRIVAFTFPMTHALTLWNRVFFLDTLTGTLPSFVALFLFWIASTVIVTRLIRKEVEGT